MRTRKLGFLSDFKSQVLMAILDCRLPNSFFCLGNHIIRISRYLTFNHNELVNGHLNHGENDLRRFSIPEDHSYLVQLKMKIVLPQ